MDPVGVAASVITLIDLAIKVVTVVNNLARSYHQAPAELLNLKYQLMGLNSQLALLQHAQRAVVNGDLMLGAADLKNLELFLEDTLPLLSSIRDYFEQQLLKSGKGRRLKWALHESSRVKRWESDLRHHTRALVTILLLLNLRYASLLQADFRDIKHNISLSQAITARLQSSARARFLWARNSVGCHWILPSIAKLEGSICSVKEGYKHVYTISLRLHALLLFKALCAELKLFRTSIFSISLSTIGCSLKVKNVVPESSQIMTACRRGDVSTVWSLFQAGTASVNDITSENYSPLLYAIESDSMSLVSFLLNNGADANESFGQFQSSPIQCAFVYRRLHIAQLLLSNGADVQYVDARGWTPTFSLFGFSALHGQSTTCEEYLGILSAASFTKYDAQDGEGWSCMHRAAAFDLSGDIVALVNLHAPLDLRTIKASWTPIFCAVQFGNVSTFNELRKYHPDFLIMSDVRKWTLLHVAVNAKRVEVIQLLISLGADPHAQSLSTEFLVPDDIKGLSVTPGDIARLRGPLVLSTYTNALRANGHDLEVVADEMDNSDDIFWPALDKLGEIVKIGR